jgi:hypothetical protein
VLALAMASPGHHVVDRFHTAGRARRWISVGLNDGLCRIVAHAPTGRARDHSRRLCCPIGRRARPSITSRAAAARPCRGDRRETSPQRRSDSVRAPARALRAAGTRGHGRGRRVPARV